MIKDEINPYDNLTDDTIRHIARDRDINIQGDGRIILNEYDQIYPEWKDNILRIKLDNKVMSKFGEDELLFYIANLGINTRNLNFQDYETADLRKFIYLYLTFKQLAKEQKLVPNPVQTLYQNPIISNPDSLFKVFNSGAIVPPELVTDIPVERRSIFTVEHPVYDYLLELAYFPAFNDSEYYFMLANDKRMMEQIFQVIYGEPRYSITTIEEKFFMLTRNYPPKDFTSKIKRYNELRIYTDNELRAIRLSHNLDADTPKLYDTKSNSIEKFIFAYHNSDKSDKVVREIANQAGMYIPVYVNANEYFLDNIAEYRFIFVRESKLNDIYINNPKTITAYNMEWYTDFELFERLRALTAFSSRQDMFLKFIDLVNTSMFFIPLVERTCRNKETIVSFNDIPSDMNELVIGYGTYTNYYCFDIEDLIDSFGRESGGRFRFNNPTEMNSQFTVIQIEQLKRLLQGFIDKPNVNELLELIDQGLREQRNMSEAERKLVIQFDQFTKPTRELIKDWLMQLFYTGMYMRQWIGPPEPYPLTSIQTNRCTNLDPELHFKVNQELYILFETEDNLLKLQNNVLELLRNLPTVEYNVGNNHSHNIESKTIGAYITSVRNGTYCIRMGSTKFIGTAYYYLTLFFPGIDIPNFDIRRLEKIM